MIFQSRRTLLPIALAFLLAFPLFAMAGEPEIQQGTKAFKGRNFKRAQELLKADATAGNGEAQFMMGVMAQEGLGMKQDIPMAMKMFDGAANAGHPWAGYRMGVIYRDGRYGVKKDQEIANRYFYMAAQAGNRDARRIMAGRMKGGKFEMKVTPAQQAKLEEALATHSRDEDEKAFAQFMDLAKQDVAEAQYWIARFYHDGEGVKQSYQDSATWAQKSGAAGHPLGALLAAHLIDFHGIPSNDRKQAIQWWYSAGHEFLEVDNVSAAKSMLAYIQGADSTDPSGMKLLKEIQTKESAAARKKG